MTDGTPPRARRGLKGAAADLPAALLGLGQTRLELAAVEFEEVRARTTQNLALVMVAALCFAFALLAASLLVVVLFWETHRIPALCGVTVVYALVGLLAVWRLAERKKTHAPAFAATIAELERDRAWLASRFGDNK